MPKGLLNCDGPPIISNHADNGELIVPNPSVILSEVRRSRTQSKDPESASAAQRKGISLWAFRVKSKGRTPKLSLKNI
jgi:hypothetical protein